MKKIISAVICVCLILGLSSVFAVDNFCKYKTKYRTHDAQKGYTEKEFICKRPSREAEGYCHLHSKKDNKSPWEIELIFRDVKLNFPMIGTYLRNADISFAVLASNSWDLSDFQGSKMNSCIISGVSLIGVNFKDCDLYGTNFGYSFASESFFDGANLQNSDFFGAKCEKSSFKNVNFKNAKLVDTNFKDADFEGAIFDRMKISPKALDGAKNLDKIAWKSVISGYEAQGLEEFAIAQYQYLENLYTGIGNTELAQKFKQANEGVNIAYQTKRSLAEVKVPKEPFTLPKWVWILIVSIASLCMIFLAVFFASKKNKNIKTE